MGEKYTYTPGGAKTYEGLGIKDTSYEMAFSEAARMLGDIHEKDLLDFGSGPGRSAKFLKELGARRVIGVDHDQNMISQAQATTETGIEFHLIKDKIPLADNSTDGALSTSALVEIKTLAEMKKTLTEIARVLKPGGILVITTANPEGFGHNFKNYSRTGDPENLKSGDITQCTVKGEKPLVIEDVYWNREDYQQALETAGFTIEEVVFPKAETGTDWLDETKVAPEMVIKAKK